VTPATSDFRSYKTSQQRPRHLGRVVAVGRAAAVDVEEGTDAVVVFLQLFGDEIRVSARLFQLLLVEEQVTGKHGKPGEKRRHRLRAGNRLHNSRHALVTAFRLQHEALVSLRELAPSSW